MLKIVYENKNVKYMGQYYLCIKMRICCHYILWEMHQCKKCDEKLLAVMTKINETYWHERCDFL